MRLDYAIASDRGLVRENNEDSAYAGPHLLALADGMGGHAAGEVASQIMINFLRTLDQDPQDNDMLALLASGADEANAEIAEGIRQAPETEGMGTTLTALMFNGEEFAMCHVGDSRGYLLRDGVLRQITVDDTYVQSLVEQGKLDPEEVSTHPMRSMILKAYSGTPVEPTLEMISTQPGDRILLCSDGLSDPVTHSTIEQTLGVGTPDQAARRLVELALRSGGPDNVTVVVSDVVDGETDHEVSTTPLTGGALSGTIEEDPRPDTAAGRAAMMIAERKSHTIPPSDGEPPQPTKSKKRPVAIAFIVLLALILAGWWGVHHLQNSFYITTASSSDSEADNASELGAELVIEQGANVSLLGKDLHSTYQVACLSPSGELTMISASSTEDCHRFNLADLTESARAEVSSLPRGNYDETLQRMQHLAQNVLPVCVIRESSSTRTSAEASAPVTTSAAASAAPSGSAEPTAEPTSSAASAATSTSAQASSEPQTPSAGQSSGGLGDLTTPGVNCREVN